MMVEAEREIGREWKIAEIKQQIAAGTYDTPDKIDAAIEKILSRFEEGGDDAAPRQPR